MPLARRRLPPAPDFSRRNFLVRCCQGASALLVPRALSGLVGQMGGVAACGDPHSADGQFHVHPQYRAPDPLDRILLRTEPGHDQFISETYQQQIAAILSEWSASLRQSTSGLEAFSKALGADFRGSSWRRAQSRVARSGNGVEVQESTFAAPELGRSAFLDELRGWLSDFAKVQTTEFQVTSISADSMLAGGIPGLVRTRVRYEVAGAGRVSHRERRTGHWELEWEGRPNDGFQLRRWQALEETRCRSASPIFSDVTAHAFGPNACYAAQLLHGADYWRTVLDGACGIDIYGHNGVSVGDIDNDGFDDVYVCQPAGLPNRLFRNRGDGTFEDITEEAGVGVLENTACALFADFDNDGRQDLVVVRANGPLLFVNEGGGKFRQRPDAFQFATPPQGTFTGAAAADYDRDGWLDIYFCLYVYYQGADQYRYPCPYYDAENGPPNFLMRNNRDGTFSDATAQAGLNRNNTRYSFCCGWSDYDGDGWPDLYVVNDFGRKNLYRNNGDGTFSDVAAEAGVEDTGAGMGVCWMDYDNDGKQDLYVADMWTAAGERISRQDVFQKDAPAAVRALYRKHAMGNSLFKNTGKGDFRDQTAPAGVGMGRWAWSCDAWDFDHDGFLDLYVANGMVTGLSQEDLNGFFWRQVVANSPQQGRPTHAYEQGWNAINELIRSDGTWSGYERNVFYANNGDGTFSDLSAVAGMDFLEDGRAFALADFDQDGRLEVLVKNRNAPQLRLARNVMRKLPPSIAFRLRGTKSNRDAIGAVVMLRTELGQQVRQLQAGSGFLSQHSKDLHFGLGAAKGPFRASIRWPSGLVQEIHELPPNHRVWVEEGSEALRVEPFRAPAAWSGSEGGGEAPESLPTTVETWLLAPIAAPEFSLPDLRGKTWSLAELRGRPALLHFWSARACGEGLDGFSREHARRTAQGLQFLAVNLDEEEAPAVRARPFPFPVLRGSAEVAAIYSILFRYLFDRHRDLPLPISFLIDEQGEIVKVYQGILTLEKAEADAKRIPKTTAERLGRALPFAGMTSTFEFSRNHLSYGSVFFQHGYYRQAGESFARALREDASSAEAMYGLGSVYLKQNERAEARQSFERAVKLKASYPDTLPNAWNNLGLLSAEEGRMGEAAGYFQQALQLNPESVIALVNLGNVYRQQRKWDNARETFRRALAVDPESAEGNYGLAMVYAAADDTQRTYDYLQKALQVRPDYAEALNNLGILYMRSRRRDDAVATLKKCMDVAPEFDQCYLNLARIYSLEGNAGEARSVLQRLLKQQPGNERAKRALVELGR